MNTEAEIRDLAARGYSREMTRQTLGIKCHKFRQMLAALPDIRWAAFGATVGRKLYADSIRGECPDYKRKSLAKAQAERAVGYTHTVRGVTGSLPALAKHFGVVSYDCARTRIKKEGMTIEQALTTPARPSGMGGIRKMKSV